MLVNWRNWCRLCAKIDPLDSILINETNSLKNQLEIFGNFFGITVRYFALFLDYIILN